MGSHWVMLTRFVSTARQLKVERVEIKSVCRDRQTSISPRWVRRKSLNNQKMGDLEDERNARKKKKPGKENQKKVGRIKNPARKQMGSSAPMVGVGLLLG